jgi:hypothetical protein
MHLDPMPPAQYRWTMPILSLDSPMPPVKDQSYTPGRFGIIAFFAGM